MSCRRQRTGRAALWCCALACAGSLLAEGPPATLDLAALLREADVENRTVAALRARAGAVQATVPQAGALPDPLLRLSYTNEGIDEFTYGEAMDSSVLVSWEQEVPYPGKRRLAGDVARTEVQVARAELDIARRALRADVLEAFFDLMESDGVSRVLADSRTVLQTLLESARVRYETGEGVLENLLKAQSALTRLDIELAEIDTRRLGAVARIHALLGRSPDATLPPVVEAPRMHLPDPEVALAAARSSSPEVERLRRLELRGEAQLAVAQRNLRPDLMWGVSWAERGELDPMVMGMVGARLPLWSRSKQRHAVIQAERELEAARREREAGGLDAAGEVSGAIAEAFRARRVLDAVESTLIPQARSTLDAASASYGAGQAEFITLLDDAVDLLELEKERHRQRAALGRALARIEARTGLELIEPVREEPEP